MRENGRLFTPLSTSLTRQIFGFLPMIYSRKLGEQVEQKATIPNANDVCGPDQATQNIAN
jgi:hypothetical protein